MVALTITIALSTMHVLFPALAGYAERTTNEQAGVLVLLLFAVPFLTPLFRRIVGERAAPLAVLALATWRVAVLFGHRIPLAGALVGAIVGLVALTLVLTRDWSQGVAVVGVLGGFALEILSRSLFATWDPVWQRTVPALVLGIGVAVTLAVTAMRTMWVAAPRYEAPERVGGFASGVAVGALMVPETLFLSSTGFVASSAGITLAVAAVVIMGGVVTACLTAARFGASAPRAVVAGSGLAVIGALLPTVHGAGSVVVLVLAGQALAAIVLVGALDRVRGSRARAEVGLACGWLIFGVSVLLYQVHFDQPLPFHNRWIIATAGALTVFAALGLPPSASRAERATLRHPSALLAKFVLTGTAVVLVVLMTTGATSSLTTTPQTLRVVEWNVRQAVTDNGQLDPEGVARALLAGGPPDVVVLAEVARGWPMSGDLDLASWLSRRLGLDFVWAGAADQQFGNVVLSRLSIISSTVTRLPVAGDSQGRSVLRAELALGDGDTLTILATHLQHRNNTASMSARMAELRTIVDLWAGAPRTILVGDLNPRQGDEPAFPPRIPRDFAEIRVILDAGFTTAQNLDRCELPTSNRNCSDFIFVTPDLHETAIDVAASSLSDHRPVTTMISL